MASDRHADELHQIVLDRIEAADKRLLRTVDYMVAGGDVVKPVWEGYSGTMHLGIVDEIPGDYWERYDD